MTNKFSCRKRKPRRLILEAVPYHSEEQPGNGESLRIALADLLAVLIEQRLETGELVIENGIVRVNPKGSNHEPEF